MTKYIAIIIIVLIAAVVVYLFFVKKKDDTKKTGNKEDAVKFVQRLTELSYFKYADAKDIDSLKKDMMDSYDPDGGPTSIWDENMVPKDYRYYFCDGEDLFEQGGFTEMLKYMQPTFNKIGLTINVTAHTEIADNNGLNHTIIINGTEYIVFKNFTGYGWGEAVERFVTIINDQLQKQNKEDRLYPISGGNDGTIIFLSDAQFAYIDSIYKNDKWKPLRIKDWCRVNEVAH